MGVALSPRAGVALSPRFAYCSVINSKQSVRGRCFATPRGRCFVTPLWHIVQSLIETELSPVFAKSALAECAELFNTAAPGWGVAVRPSVRVRLAKFYGATFENRSSHFKESPDYLRHLGVLDETGPRQLSVVLTNYIYAQVNGVASSGLYSICCIDECEALMAQLERSIAKPLCGALARCFVTPLVYIVRSVI